MKQEIVFAGGGPNYAWSQDHIYIKSARDLTADRVTLVEDHLKPGFHLARHYHKVMTEIFYILEGEIIYTFDDEQVVATSGMTINIPPHIWHDVQCPNGGKIITIFSPGGFDTYLEELAALTEAQSADAAYLTALAEQYDTWLT